MALLEGMEPKNHHVIVAEEFEKAVKSTVAGVRPKDRPNLKSREKLVLKAKKVEEASDGKDAKPASPKKQAPDGKGEVTKDTNE